MRKIQDWNNYDWNQDGDDRLKLWVCTKRLPDSLRRMKEYLSETEEENMKYSHVANAIVANQKATETDPEIVPAKGFRGHYDRHTRYILTKNANKRKEHVSAIRKANARKRFFGNDAYIIISGFEGKERTFFKECRIMERNLIERQRRDRRDGKKICRDEMMRMGV